ncbi:unnamed protein product, partial [marine sediment metagenome]
GLTWRRGYGRFTPRRSDPLSWMAGPDEASSRAERVMPLATCHVYPNWQQLSAMC